MNDKFFTKKNIKTIFISLFLVLIYILVDVIFMSGDYQTTVYTTGIHGIGDAIAKILIKIKPDSFPNTTFNGLFASIFVGCVNLFLFIFISFPKLDFKFSMNSLINTIAFVILLFIFTFLINKPDGQLHFLSHGFGLIKKDSGFGLSLLRVIIVSCSTGFIISFCIKTGSSTGGIDIIAKYLSIYKKKNISFCINILNYIIAIFSVSFLYFYQREIHFISLLLTFIKLLITSFIIYFMLNKFNSQPDN
ncbi:MAG: YitT family protein [Phytoplasma sp.]|uniref:YitT family protein n=1 Tax=Phytoplasma sp. TaxID=2155 RepID=UPI002B40E8C1|nr:YitT family protein [Phytoplasma sp.]WRH06833.1 MAG: YitT family protein [Phytoplasma sp.]